MRLHLWGNLTVRCSRNLSKKNGKKKWSGGWKRWIVLKCNLILHLTRCSNVPRPHYDIAFETMVDGKASMNPIHWLLPCALNVSLCYQLYFIISLLNTTFLPCYKSDLIWPHREACMSEFGPKKMGLFMIIYGLYTIQTLEIRKHPPHVHPSQYGHWLCIFTKHKISTLSCEEFHRPLPTPAVK